MQSPVHWVFTEEASTLKTLWSEESKFDSYAVQNASFDKIKTFEGMRKTRKYYHFNKSFPVELLITLYKVVLTFESVNEIRKCDHSKESYWAVLSCGTVYYVVQGVSSLWACERNSLRKQPCFRRLVDESWSVTIQIKATKQYFLVVLFITLYRVVLTFESVDKILRCDHLNESYWAVLSCGSVNHAKQGQWF